MYSMVSTLKKFFADCSETTEFCVKVHWYTFRLCNSAIFFISVSLLNGAQVSRGKINSGDSFFSFKGRSLFWKGFFIQVSKKESYELFPLINMMDTIWEATLLFSFFPLYSMASTHKRKNCSSRSKFFLLRVDQLRKNFIGKGSKRQSRNLSPFEIMVGKHGWMTCDFFMSFPTVFQSYQDDGRLIMKGCVQWNSVYS